MKSKLLLILTLLIKCIIGQSETINFYHLNSAKGLSQNTVNCIYKDSREYFWFGTSDGLNKWDGNSFQAFQHSVSDSNSIANGRIHGICEDSVGNLWLALSNGVVSKFIPERNQFINYYIPRGQKKKTADKIAGVFMHKASILVASSYNGVYQFNQKEKLFKKIQLINPKGQRCTPKIINSISSQDKQSLWLNTSEGALKLKLNSESVKNCAFQIQQVLPKCNVFDVFVDSRKSLWLGTLEQGVYRIDSLNKIRHFAPGVENGKMVNSKCVKSFTEDQKGRIWMATNGNGISIYNYETDAFQYYTSDMADQYSISSNIINVLYKDKNEDIWIGTYNRGIWRTNLSKQRFNHTKSFGRPGELTDNSVLSFCEITPKAIWIGTDGGGLNIFNPQTNRISPAILNGENFSTNKVVTCIKYNGNRYIYIGTFKEGLYIYDISLDKLSQYKFPNQIPNASIWDIAIDKENKLWLATLGGGVIKFDPLTREEETLSLVKDSEMTPELAYLSSIYCDSKNNIWIGTYHGGLFKIDTNRNINQILPSSINLHINEVHAITEDSKGQVWFGGHGKGVYRVDKNTDTYTQIDLGKGSGGLSVQAIEEGTDGNLWVATTQGIFALEINGEKSIQRHYMELDGLQANEFNIHASLRTSDGTLLFGGINGFNHFKPQHINDNGSVGSVVIQSLKVLTGNSYQRKNNILSEQLARSGNINLNYKQSTISFGFVILDYKNPAKNTYKYRLLPIEKNWVNANNRNSVTYTNLKAGEYEFQVYGINCDSRQSENYASLKLTLAPPFWRSILFKITLIIVGISLVILIYWNRVNKFKEQQKRLRDIVALRTSELKKLNQSLEESNKEIEIKSAELQKRQEELVAANKKLETSNFKIENQKAELIAHQNNLEDLVNSRTSELEKAKLKAEESERLKMAFLSNMSHEIRTPMNAIIGFASLLTEDDLGKDERAEYIQQVNSNSDSLLVLIDDILDLSKIEANQLDISKSVFEIKEFIEQLAVNWMHLNNKSEGHVLFRCTIDIGVKPIYLDSDKLRIRQILNNLLDNAFKFTEKGEVHLVAKSEASNIVFSVSDTGVGIAKNDIKNIFDRFRKGAIGNKKLYRGAGLGLTISHKLAHLINGKMWVERRDEGGSVFYLSLPCFQDKPGGGHVEAEQQNLDDSENLRNIKILIAEDEKANYDYLKGFLTKNGALVEHAENGDQVVKMASLKDYDIILMDIKMPGQNGVQATKKIKTISPKQVVIAQTAYARPEEEAEFRKVGFDDYVIKPIKTEVLLKVIKKHIAPDS